MTDDRRGSESSWWGRVCRTLYANPLFKPFLSSTRGRRGLVIGYVMILVAFPLASWLTGSVIAVAVIALPYVIATLMIAVATGGVLDKPMRRLDERQRQVRQTIFADPYATGAALGLAGGLVIAFSLQAEDALALGVFMFVFGMLFGLPSMLYAWSIQDVDDEDQ